MFYLHAQANQTGDLLSKISCRGSTYTHLGNVRPYVPVLHHMFYVDVLKCLTQTTWKSGTVLFLFWWNLHSEKARVHLALFIRESSMSNCCPTNFVQQITDLFLFTVSISNQKCHTATEQYSKLLWQVAELVEQWAVRRKLWRDCCLSLFTPVTWHQDGLILCFANQSCHWDFTVNILDQLPTIRRKIH